MITTPPLRSLVFAYALFVSASFARADALTDWNQTALDTVDASGEHLGYRLQAMAMVHVAMLEALNFIQGRYKPHFVVVPPMPAGMSPDATVTGAAHHVLVELYPDRKDALDAKVKASLQAIPDDTKSSSVIAGKSIAAVICALRLGDSGDPLEPDKPSAVQVTQGLFVVPNGARRPKLETWTLDTARQFRPAPPPGPNSRRWAEDANELKLMGGLISTVRTPEQTQIGRFWSDAGPLSWNAIVEQLVAAKGLGLIERTRIHALVSMAIADAYTAAWDAQYAYSFGPPLAALRNRVNSDDRDANQDSGWLPLVDAPTRFEYPCAPCVASGAVAAILESELGSGGVPEITLTSNAAPGVTRRWTRIRDYADEVSVGQIYGGRSYRTATEVGQEIGKKIGHYALLRYFTPAKL